MEFKVVSFNPSNAQIVVEVGEMRLAIDLPIDDDGRVPEGAELEKFVMAFVPPETLRRQRLLARWGGVRNAESIQRLIAIDSAPEAPVGGASDLYLQDINLSSI